MTLESPTVAPALADDIHSKLQAASAPLKFAEVVKGLSRPKRIKADDFQEEVRTILAEEVRLGRVFSQPSGKSGEARYWGRDEKQVLRDKTLDLAANPLPIAMLKTKLGQEVKGTDPAFLEPLVRDLIQDGRLFEYPPASRKGQPRFGATAPPPPLPTLERGRFLPTLNRLDTECRKLLHAAGVGPDELVEALRVRLNTLGPLAPAPKPGPAAPESPEVETAAAPGSEPAALPRPERATAGSVEPRQPPEVTEPPSFSGSGIEDLILKAVENAPVVSLADLRREMPREFQGREFDDAILRLADEGQVVISRDADPGRFNDADRAAYVQDGTAVFTTVARRS
jgi:hypothetical protein